MSDKGKTTTPDYSKPLRFPDDYMSVRTNVEALGRLVDRKTRNLSDQQLVELYRVPRYPA